MAKGKNFVTGILVRAETEGVRKMAKVTKKSLEDIYEEMGYGKLQAKEYNLAVENSFSKTSRAAQAFGDKIGALHPKLAGLGASLAKIAGPLIATGGTIAAIGKATHSLVLMGDQVLLLEARLRNVTSSTSNLNAVFSELVKMSYSSRSPLKDNVELYTRASLALEAYGYSQQTVIDLTETLAIGLRIGGATAAEATGSITQFSQGLALGRFETQELKSVLEQSVPIARALGQEFANEQKAGESLQGTLLRLAESGELSVDRVVSALSGDTLTDFRSMLENLPVTAAEGWETLSSSIALVSGELSKGMGLSEGYGNFFRDLAGDVLELKDPMFETGLVLEDFATKTIAFFNLINELSDFDDSFWDMPWNSNKYDITALDKFYATWAQSTANQKRAEEELSSGTVSSNDDIANSLEKLTKEQQRYIDKLNAAVLSQSNFNKEMDALDKLRPHISAESYNQELEALEKKYETLNPYLMAYREGLEKAAKASSDAEQKTAKLVATLNAAPKTLESYNRRKAEYVRLNKDEGLTTAGLTLALEDLKQEYRNLFPEEARIAEMREEAALLVKGLATEQDLYNEKLERYAVLVNKKFLTEENAERLRLQDLDKLNVANQETAEEATSHWDGFRDDVTNAFEDTFIRAESSLKDFLGRIKDALKEAGLRTLFRSLLGGLSLGGSAGALAGVSGGGSGGGGFGLVDGLGAAGGIKSLLSTTAGGALGTLGGTLLGGIDGFAKVVASTFGEGAVSNAVSNAYSSMFNTTSGAGEMLGLTGDSAFGAGALMSAGAGVAGSFAGNALGQGIFGKQAESSVGATAGGLIGSFLGPLGSFLGSTLGSMVDVALGGDGKKRTNIGALVGTGERSGGRFGEYSTGASGLTFQSFNRRGDQSAANSFTEALLAIDNSLTAMATVAGATVDFSGRSNLGTAADAGHGGAGSFFGLKAFNGKVGAATLEESAKEFVETFIGEINDQLPLRVRKLHGSITGTAQELVTAFAAAVNIDMLLGVDVVNETTDALEVLQDAQQSVIEQYREITAATVEAAENLDGSSQALVSLSDSLTLQKNAALELTLAYKSIGEELDTLLNDTIQSIQESILTDEQIYSIRRAEIATLSDQLAGAISPEEIDRLTRQIDEATKDAFSLLDDSQKSVLAADFVNFLMGTKDTAQARVNAGLDEISASDNQITQLVDVELRGVDTFAEAVDTFAQVVENSGGAGTGSGYIGPPDSTDDSNYEVGFVG